jgi:ABC-type sugar transport system substrate-binding protein
MEAGKKGTSRRTFLAASGGALAGAALLSPTQAVAAGQALPRLRGSQRFVWVAGNIADPFYRDGIRGMKAFSRIFGVPVRMVGPQKNDIAAMAKTFSTVVVDPKTTGIFSYFYGGFDAVKTLYEDAETKNIPIVNGAGDWGPPRISFVGVRDQDAPSAAVDYIAKSLNEGKVGFIGNTGVNLIREEKFFRQFVKERLKNVDYVGNATHDGSASDALKQFQAYKQKNPDLSVVFFGDGLGPSIADPLAAAAGDTKLILRGFGANGQAALKKGKILALIDRSPFDEEFYGFQMLYWWKLGQRVPDTVVVPTFVIDSAKIAAFSRNPDRRS